MNNLKLALVVFTSFCLLHNVLIAQASTSSPYSRYGIGDINAKGFSNNFAMGGTYIAVQNDSAPVFFINNGNPASYASMPLTTADLGVNLTRLQLQNSTAKQSIYSGAISYIALAFPITKWWGSSVGLKPYSMVGYNVTSQQQVDSVGSIDYIYQGAGGVNQVYFGNAFKPLYGLPKLFLKSKKYEALEQQKNKLNTDSINNIIQKIVKRKQVWQALSIGANASYIFGNIDQVERSVFPKAGLAINTRTGTNTRIGDIGFDYGMQYAYTIDSLNGRDLKDNVKLLFGATLSTQTNLNAKIDTLSYSYYYNSAGAGIISDTIKNTQSNKGEITIPLSFGFGLGFKKGDKWLIASDYAIQNWSNYKTFNQSQGFKNSMRVSVGVQYTPNTEGNYFKRINYRLGARYAQTMVVIKGYQLTEQAITFGVGLPVGTNRIMQSFSMVNIGAEIGNRGTTADGLIKEQFLKISIGFTLNDKWFQKYKID